MEPRAAGCVVVRAGALLMVQSQRGQWSLPAGGVEPGESGPAAAVRETREEAGITVTVGPPVCAVPSHAFVAYACTAPAGAQPVPDGTETRAARFVGREELAALPLRFPQQRDAYLGALPAAVP